jgi:hypothetical protein
VMAPDNYPTVEVTVANIDTNEPVWSGVEDTQAPFDRFAPSDPLNTEPNRRRGAEGGGKATSTFRAQVATGSSPVGIRAAGPRRGLPSTALS